MIDAEKDRRPAAVPYLYTTSPSSPMSSPDQHSIWSERMQSTPGQNRLDISDSDISGSSFRNSNVSGALFDDANLCGAEFTNTNLSGARFDDANMSGAAIRNANLSGLAIDDCELAGMTINGVSVGELFAAYARVNTGV
jgi:uncharacterized protein YjbI with pentapeptide repeats